MDTGITIALIGLLGGVVTATVGLLINRLNRKDQKEDRASQNIADALDSINSKLIPLQRMCVSSVGDKLRHYASKYLAKGLEADIQSVRDWLSLEESYEENGGNGHIKKLRPEMEELLIMLEKNKEKKNV